MTEFELDVDENDLVGMLKTNLRCPGATLTMTFDDGARKVSCDVVVEELSEGFADIGGYLGEYERYYRGPDRKVGVKLRTIKTSVPNRVPKPIRARQLDPEDNELSSERSIPALEREKR